MSAYYNEIDPYAADWLRNLIKAGHIADGVVDTRSISDIHPEDLREFTQCHFFAGIGVWSRALRMAQWPDTRAVWTGSCPCQPFSVAGSGAGVFDERHLWPHWFWLIEQCRPAVVFGEQVEAAIRHGWLDLVQADMEGIDYSFAPVGIPAAGVGAPHIRQRLWFVAQGVAHADTGQRIRPQEQVRAGRSAADGGSGHGGLAHAESTRPEHGVFHAGDGRQGVLSASREPSNNSTDSGMAHAPSGGRGQEQSDGRGGVARDGARQVVVRTGGGGTGRVDHHHHQGLEGHGRGHCAEIGQRQGQVRPVAEAGEPGGVADADDCGPPSDAGAQRGVPQGAHQFVGGRGNAFRPGPTNGHWGSADWIFCRDGKWRAIEPGTFPLAHGAAARVGRLRAYGNAIVAQVASEVISAYMEVAA